MSTAPHRTATVTADLAVRRYDLGGTGGPDPDGPRLSFDGALLGAATSESDLHRGHDGRTFAPKGVKCSACRWLTVAIYATSHGYVVHTVGASDVPDETDYEKITETASAFDVVELLTVRRARHGSPVETFVPPQYARALAQAASLDDGIREAYVNRAVA